MSGPQVTEISSQSEDERLFRVIAGETSLQHGTEMRPIILNNRAEIIDAIGIMPGDAISADKPFLIATTFKVTPEQWRDEHKDAREFTVAIKYK